MAAVTGPSVTGQPKDLESPLQVFGVAVVDSISTLGLPAEAPEGGVGHQ